MIKYCGISIKMRQFPWKCMEFRRIPISFEKDCEREMTVVTSSIELETRGNADVLDITQFVEDAIRNSGVNNGIVTIFCPSSTSALTTIEYETGCIKDLRRLFDEILDPQRNYAHDARWHDGNGHSHIRASLLGASLTVPFVASNLTLGTWQQIIYVDFDTRNRRRELVVQILGD
jgi:secondary thiamine-phosphate synthase enzyme